MIGKSLVSICWLAIQFNSIHSRYKKLQRMMHLTLQWQSVDEERSEASAKYEGTLIKGCGVAVTNCQKLSEVAVEVKPQSSHAEGTSCRRHQATNAKFG
jgi:hypothetical protein